MLSNLIVAGKQDFTETVQVVDSFELPTLCISSPAESIGFLTVLTMQWLNPDIQFGFYSRNLGVEGEGLDNTLHDLTPAGEWALHSIVRLGFKGMTPYESHRWASVPL